MPPIATVPPNTGASAALPPVTGGPLPLARYERLYSSPAPIATEPYFGFNGRGW